MALRLNVDTGAPSDRVLLLAAEVIQAGGVIVYPTDTLYGLGANAWNPGAVLRIHSVKKRDPGKPILVLVHSPEAALGLTDEVTPEARDLMTSFWPGPLTLLFRSAMHVPAVLTGGSGKIGVRLPSHRFCTHLAELAGCPLASTSANISGSPAARTLAEIEAGLGGGVDLFIDGGALPRGLPSTVVDVAGGGARLVREGVIPFTELRKIVPDITPRER